jgi:DNA-3-methyladenine glycosylase
MNKLLREFFNRDARIVAEELIGKILVREYKGRKMSVKISETEAYIGAIDKASHCYRGRTERNSVMFGPPGYAYVYFIYGMYYCLNFVVDEEEHGSGVLIRGGIPFENAEDMCMNRYGVPMSDINKNQLKNLCNGPGKLCMALKITKEQNGMDLMGNQLYLVDDGFKNFSVKNSKRINIDYAEEARDFMWRYILHEK